MALNLLDSAYGERFEPYLLGAVAAALVLAASATLFRAVFRPTSRRASVRWPACGGCGARRRRSPSVLVLGFILGLTSVGSGALVGLALILLYRLEPRRVVGTDVFHAAVLLWSAGLAHLRSGNVDLGLMATILVGSLPGVEGAALLPYVPVAGLRHALGIILVAAALGVLTKAGVVVPPIVLAGIPALLAVASVAVHRRRLA